LESDHDENADLRRKGADATTRSSSADNRTNNNRTNNNHTNNNHTDNDLRETSRKDKKNGPSPSTTISDLQRKNAAGLSSITNPGGKYSDGTDKKRPRAPDSREYVKGTNTG
jgi:hypothetical protein